MKSLVLFLFIIASTLRAENSEIKLMNIIFTSLYPNKNFVVYTNEENKKEILIQAGIKYSENCFDADIAYSSTSIQECKNKPLFTDNYKTFKNTENAIGAFYWKKGRPNIYFLKLRLNRYNLTLPKILEKYEIDRL